MINACKLVLYSGLLFFGLLTHAHAAQATLDEMLTEERPIAAADTIWIDEMTWMEVRDAQAAGFKTAIVATGGIEQNGPYVATGKHNFILRPACELLARSLGQTLCAPIVKFVPEGDFNPPSGHMQFPGTIGVSQETFVALLTDIGTSLKVTGFDKLYFIGDSGGNPQGMVQAAEQLNQSFDEKFAHHVTEFYNNEGLIAYQASLGITEKSQGYHDFYWATAMQMVADPQSVRLAQREEAGLASINGVSLLPVAHTLEVGAKLLAWRVQQAVDGIRRVEAQSQVTE